MFCNEKIKKYLQWVASGCGRGGGHIFFLHIPGVGGHTFLFEKTGRAGFFFFFANHKKMYPPPHTHTHHHHHHHLVLNDSALSSPEPKMGELII